MVGGSGGNGGNGFAGATKERRRTEAVRLSACVARRHRGTRDYKREPLICRGTALACTLLRPVAAYGGNRTAATFASSQRGLMTRFTPFTSWSTLKLNTSPTGNAVRRKYVRSCAW